LRPEQRRPSAGLTGGLTVPQPPCRWWFDCRTGQSTAGPAVPPRGGALVSRENQIREPEVRMSNRAVHCRAGSAPTWGRVGFAGEPDPQAGHHARWFDCRTGQSTAGPAGPTWGRVGFAGEPDLQAGGPPVQPGRPLRGRQRPHVGASWFRGRTRSASRRFDRAQPERWVTVRPETSVTLIAPQLGRAR